MVYYYHSMAPTAFPGSIRGISLADGERVQYVHRPALVSLGWRALVAVLTLLVPFFLLYPLWQWQTWGPLTFGVLLVGALGWSGRLWLVWRGGQFIATTARFIDIDQRGVFDRVVTETPIAHVSDIRFRRRGVWQTLWRYGTVEYTITPGSATVALRGVRLPEKVTHRLSDIVNGTAAPVAAPTIRTAAELRAFLRTIRHELGGAAFTKVIASLDEADSNQSPNQLE